MRVSDIQVISADDACRVQARVESDRDPDHDDWFAPFTLCYRFPAWCRPYLSPENGDPFLAALLFPAMSTSERLVLPAPISPKIEEALPEIQAIYAAFDSRARTVAVEAPARQRSLPANGENQGVGLFFSLGIDSFYSLLKNEGEHPADSKTVTHLIHILGFDVASEEQDSASPAQLLRNLERVAAEKGKTLVPVATNMRRVTLRLAPWTMVHGGALASVALALEGLLRRVLIAASTTYDVLESWGTHPILDPLWSTESLTVIHDGCEMNTIDKTRVIARSQLVLDTLRTCPGYGPGYNCGKCRKCLRAAIDLLQAGYLDRCRTLPHAIDPEHLRQALGPGGGALHAVNWQRRLEAFAASGAAPELRKVLAEHLDHREHGKAKTSPRRGFLARWLRCVRC